MNRKTVSGILVIAFLLMAQAAFAEDVTEQSGKSTINWTKKEIVFTGDGAPNLKAPNAASGRLGAERAAELVALRNALEALKGVKIRSGMSIGDKMQQTPGITAEVEGIVKGFIVKETRYYSDGGVQRDLVIPIDGVLTKAILGDEMKKVEVTQKEKKPCKKGKVEKRDTAAAESRAKSAAPVAKAETPKPTGLVVVAKGLKVVPVLAPKIIDQQGKDVYDVTMVESSAGNGIASYTKEEATATKDAKVTDRPLVVKAIESPNSVDLVVSDADAKLIRDNKSILAEGRVIIVKD